MALGIKHIEFWVSNLAQAMDFYSQLFALIGWQRIDSTSFGCADAKIYFKEREVGFLENAGPRHICFLADSREMVDRVGFFLNNTGVKIIRGPQESRYKSRCSYTVDFFGPDGYILEVATSSVAGA